MQTNQNNYNNKCHAGQIIVWDIRSLHNTQQKLYEYLSHDKGVTYNTAAYNVYVTGQI